ncbi:MAG: exodeoxyribonuclease VII large subunit [Clostridiales bacterium]|nr:exodeoxyribonuclease VII large subunit [Clostridiales bacterium]
MNRQMTVLQLSSYLKGVFDDEELLHDVSLTGEVAEVSYSDRHTFLTLSENDCSVRCMHFNSRDKIEKGEKIMLKGSVRFYEKRNSVSFVYNEFSPCGDGEKAAKFAELKKRLSELGYFENRLPLPKYIVNVIVITSADGAAIRDFIRVVSDKSPFVSVRVCPAKVQGVGAGEMMARAVKYLQNEKTDAIILCRGGGSDEDLDAFNDEALATAVATSKIPIISAVGHEVDYTLCDFCAGTRAGTPSIAGEIVNAHAAALINDILLLIERARSALENKQKYRETKVYDAVSSLSAAVSLGIEKKKRFISLLSERGYYSLKQKLAVKGQGVLSLAHNLNNAQTKLFRYKRDEVEKNHRLLKALDPHRILESGYAAVTLNGRLVKNVSKLKRGDKVKLVFADGSASASVDDVSKK